MARSAAEPISHPHLQETSGTHDDSATEIHERGVHNGAEHAHPENCLTGTAKGIASTRIADATESPGRVAVKAHLHAPTIVF